MNDLSIGRFAMLFEKSTLCSEQAFFYINSYILNGLDMDAVSVTINTCTRTEFINWIASRVLMK